MRQYLDAADHAPGRAPERILPQAVTVLRLTPDDPVLLARVADLEVLGQELYKKYAGRKPLFLGVLKGSFIFMADLVRAAQVMGDIEFIAVSSYQNGTASSGRVQR